MTQIFELCGIRWCFILFCSSLQYRSSKINPAFFVDKASCTRQFESELSLHSLASLFPIKKGFFLPLRLSCKESSTFSPSPSSSGSGDVTALLGARNRYAIRLAGHQSPRHVLRDGTAWGINNDGKATSQLQRRHCSITSLLKSLVVSLL